jgi:hypothetical protein
VRIALTGGKRADGAGRMVATGAKRAERGEPQALIAHDTVAVHKHARVAMALIVGILRFHYGWGRFGERIIGDVVDCGVTTVSMRARRWKSGVARAIATGLSADIRGWVRSPRNGRIRDRARLRPLPG